MDDKKVTLESLEGRYQDFCRIAHTLKQTVKGWDDEIQGKDNA